MFKFLLDYIWVYLPHIYTIERTTVRKKEKGAPLHTHINIYVIIIQKRGRWTILILNICNHLQFEKTLLFSLYILSLTQCCSSSSFPILIIIIFNRIFNNETTVNLNAVIVIIVSNKGTLCWYTRLNADYNTNKDMDMDLVNNFDVMKGRWSSLSLLLLFVVINCYRKRNLAFI